MFEESCLLSAIEELCGKIVIVRVQESVYFSYIPQGYLTLGYGLAYSLTKVPKLKQVV